MAEDEITDIAENEKVATVAGAVLTAFFDELAKTDDLAEIANNLKKRVLEDGVFAEPSMVPPVGLEPTHLAVPDFESNWACHNVLKNMI